MRENEYNVDILPEDSLICPLDSIVFDFTSFAKSVIWENNTTALIRTIHEPGRYNAVLVDSNNCVIEDTVIIALSETESAIDTTICEGQSILINDVPIFASGTYIESETTSTCNTSTTINLHVIPNTNDTLTVDLNHGAFYNWNGKMITEPGFYSTRYLSSEGCDSTEYLIVATESSKGIYIPNVFSPNGDGINDKFEVYAPKLSVLRMKIYDRWGGEVYLSEGSILTWDGMSNSNSVDEGVYLYQIILEDINGNQQQKVGTVTVLR
jgi:gliding motility-associated-like protein